MKRRVKFIVLGCPKNRADSEIVAGILGEGGYKVVSFDEKADAALLFTCAFVGDAEEESIGSIVELEHIRKQGDIGAVVVLGCMPERHSSEKGLDADLPNVDAWVGAADYRKLPKILDRIFEGKRRFTPPAKKGFLPARDPRKRLGDEPFSYLKISEGCRNRCSYCTIPSIKGDFRSRTISQIVFEAESLAEDGAREIILVGQDTALYGADRYGRRRLAGLMKNIAERLPDVWLRVMYCHPAHLDEAVLETMARFPNICKYIDLPIQHASDPILKKMRRKITKAKIEKIVRRIREIVPDVTIRTTVIVGFPGETKKDFAALMNFIETMRFERLGAFAYSPEEGTPAYRMPGQIPERIKMDRLDAVMQLQQEISFDLLQYWKGKELSVMVDHASEDRPGWVAARSMAFAPEIDGAIYIRDNGLKAGDRVWVKITDALPYDLEAEQIVR